MADVKISALPAASTPLAGTEVLPIVQGGTTDKVSVANLTAGRTVDAAAVVVGAGNVSAPGLTFSGDTNTGIYSPAADTIAFTEGGVEAMRIDASGNVGIGTTTASGRLTVAGGNVYNNTTASGTTGYYVYNGTVVGAALACDFSGPSTFLDMRGSLNFRDTNASYATRMVIAASGNVGIGTSSPNADGLTVYRANGATVALQNATTGTTAASGFQLQGGSGGDAYLWNYSNSFIAIGTNNTERARITSGGNFLVGTASTFDITSGATTQLSGQCAVFNTGSTNTLMSFYNSSQAARVGFIGSSGNSTQYNSGSDYRLKENVAAISGAGALIQSLRPVTFTWKVSPETGTFSGFIAHELQGVWPEAVSGEKDAICDDGVTPNYQMVDQSKLVPLLTAALQEALTEIAALKARVAALEAK